MSEAMWRAAAEQCSRDRQELYARISSLEQQAKSAHESASTWSRMYELAIQKNTSLNQHISELETALTQAQETVRSVDQHRNDLLRNVTALEQHISELEKSLENARNSDDVWRKRVEAAAESLADVLPGEAGRLNLVPRIEELKRQRDEAAVLWRGAKASKAAAVAILGGEEGENLKDVVERAASSLANLTPSGQVAEDEALYEALDDIGLVVVLKDRSWHLKACRAPREACSEACAGIRPALDFFSRLAAKAHGYEALSVVCATIAKSIGFTGAPDGLADPSAALLEEKRQAEQAWHDADADLTEIGQALAQRREAAGLRTAHGGVVALNLHALLERMKRLEAFVAELRDNGPGLVEPTWPPQEDINPSRAEHVFMSGASIRMLWDLCH